MKKTISIILAILMIVGTMPFALAVEEEAGTDIIDATNMTADELEDAVNAALAAGYTAISVNLVEDAESDMFTAITAPLAADGIEEGSIDLTISGATTVPDYTFYAYEDMNENYRACAVLRSVTLTDATTIGKNAFVKCENMTYFSAPKAITIAHRAFYDCYSLIKVNLPSARTIGNLAFTSCGALKEVSLPECTSIGDGAFISCFEMETIYAPKVTTIGSYAFQGCASALKTLTLGAVTSVNHDLYGIFHGNNENDMKKIDLFLSCEQKAMAYNSSTKYWTATGEAFDFGSTNKFIGYTFKSVTLAHTAEVDDGDCTTAVKCANCDETAIEAKENHVSENPENKATCQKKAICDLCGTEYGEKDANNHTGTLGTPVPTEDDTQHIATWSCCEATVTEEHTFENGKCTVCGAACTHSSFADGKCTVCGIPGGYCGSNENEGGRESLWWYFQNGTLTISGAGDMAERMYADESGWSNMRDSITALVIDKGVTGISSSAFSGLTELKSVIFAEGSLLTTIGNNAFENCSSLTEITIPAGVTDIVSNPFIGCTAMNNVFVASGNTVYKDIEGVLYTADGTTLLSYPHGQTLSGITFIPPKGVTTIGNSAFASTNVRSVELTNDLTTVGESAFDNCTMLYEITISNSVKEIDESAFWRCTELRAVHAPCGWQENPLYEFENNDYIENEYVNVRIDAHNLSSVVPSEDGLTHHKACSACGYVESTGESHSTTAEGDKAATCTTLAVCSVCGVSYGAVDTTNHDSSVECENGFCPNGCYEPATLNAEGYYEIDNAGKLFWFAQQVNVKGNREIKGVLTANIDLENKPWTPIGETGEENNNFRGVFDGQNYTIRGLNVEGSENGVGFFGEVRTGTVKNFTIYGNVVVNTKVDYVGGVIGSICGVNGETDLERNGAIIQNITSFVNVTAKAHGIGMIGGFVGYANHQSLIEQCAWYGTFDAGEYRVVSGAGGFIGNVHEGSNVTIRNCAAYGTIKTNYEKNSYNNYPTIYMGGFLSSSHTGAQTTLENCLFAGKFERGENLTDEARLGAFGTLRSVKEIKNCYYLGDDGLEAVHSDSTLKPGSDNVEIISVTGEDLRNNTIATQLGDLWEQDVHYPIPKDTKAHGDSATYTYTDNGDGTHKKTCNECGYVEVDNEAHTYKNGKCTAEGCGYACTHENNKDEKGICTVCCIAEGTCGENITWIYDSKTTTLTISGSVAMADYDNFDDMPWNNYQNYITEVVIENGVTTIGEFAFAKCTSLAAVTIGEGVTTIGDYAFSGCEALESVTIPDSVTTISDFAFCGCESLTSVTIPKSVTTIGRYAFAGCSELKTVTIGEGLTTFGDTAFYDCKALKSIEVDKNNAYYSSVDGVLFNKDKTELIYYPLGKTETSYTVPESVTTIGEGAFKDCTALTSVIIPDSVTTIGHSAFNNCTALESVTIPYSVKTIGDHAFISCTALAKIEIPDNVTTIGNYAFYNCSSLTSVTIGNSVETIGGSVFGECTKLTTIEIPDSVKTIGDSAFNNCSLLTSVTIGGSVTNISKYAFDGCTSLTTIEIPDSVTSIDSNAFQNCILLKSVTISYSETKISEWAFAGCTSLETVNVPCDWDTENPPYAFDENVLKKYHNIVIDEAVEATCTKTGLTEGKHCSRCENATVEQEEVPALNHKDTLVQVKAKAKTCTTVGWEAYEYCTACDYTTKVEIPASHEIVKVNAKPKTCTEAGHNAHEYCTACDYTTKVVIPASHELQEVKAKAPTCEAIGWDAYKHCTDCNYTTYVEKAKLGHDIVIDKAVAPTCTKTGLTEGSHCSRCNGATKAQQAVAATGHKPVVIGAKSATCSQEGYTGDTQCSVCKVSISTGTKVAKLAHKLTLVGKKAATFEAEGHTGAEVCSVCKRTINAGSVIKKLTFTTPVVTAVATKTGIKVTWNKVENAQSYIVYKRVYNESTEKWSGWEIINGNATELSLEDSNVVLGTKYRYTVRAKNGNTLSPYKSTGTVKYNVTPTVKVSNATSGIKVSWSTAANATGYRVYRSTLSNGKWSGWKNMGTAKANKTAWTDKSVKTGVTYKYTVRAVYNKVLSSYNKDGAVSLFLSTPTVKIANIANGIQVKWNSVSGATGYIVYSSQFDPVTNKWSGWANRGTVATTSWTDTTVKSGVTYKYTVRALNGNTLSAYKATGGLIYLAEPTVKISNAAKGIKVKWSQCDGATGYTVYRSEYNPETKKWSKWKSRGTAAATKSSWTDKKVTIGKTYKYTVRAVNGNFKSSYVSTGSLLYLAQPTVTVKAVDNGINVAWTQHSGATGYRVYRSELVNGEWSKWKSMGTAKASKNNWTDKSAEKGKTYKYTVRTVNGKTLSSYADGIAVSR